MKKLLGLIMAAAMVLCFAGCGDSGGDATDEGASASEPNAGILGIVFTVPDGWEQAEVYEGSYTLYHNPDSNLDIAVSTLDQAFLDDLGDEEKAKTVKEYWDEYYTYTDESLKELNADLEAVKVCGTDANTIKFKNGEKGYVDIGTSWLLDDVIYSLNLYVPDSYDEDGIVKEDAAVMSDEDIALYESMLASVQPGDGAALQMSKAKVDGLGSVTFETPEGYKLGNNAENYVEFQKEDNSKITISVTLTGEGDLEYTTDENDQPYASLKDYYNSYLYEDIETTEIAGYEGYISILPNENDKYYSYDAGFLADDGVYSIDMISDSHDEDGNLKDDAVELSEDDLAVFRSFIESFQKK